MEMRRWRRVKRILFLRRGRFKNERDRRGGWSGREKERSSLRVRRRRRRERKKVKGELQERREQMLFFLFIPSRSPFLNEDGE